MITDLHDSTQAARERERLRFQIVRQWRASNRWEFSEAEISTEVEMRLDTLNQNRTASRQLDLPPEAPQQLGHETKRESYLATRSKRFGLRDRIVDLLDQAGELGRTREELARALGVKDGSVSAPVGGLIASGQAYEPFKRISSAGQAVAVVTLTKFAVELNS
jgi:hypothetical protein